MLFSAVLMNIPSFKFCLKGESSIHNLKNLTPKIKPRIESLIIHKENTKEIMNMKKSAYVIHISLDLRKASNLIFWSHNHFVSRSIKLKSFTSHLYNIRT